MTGSASCVETKFEVGAVLLDAIHEFSSNDCTEGEGEGIGGDHLFLKYNSICQLLSNVKNKESHLYFTSIIFVCKVRSMVMGMAMERAREMEKDL